MTRGAHIEDERANKAVLYIGPDGLVSISYTGLAFVEGVPTDEWLVSTITGATDLVVDGRTPIRMGRFPYYPDVGQAVEQIRDTLNRVIPSLDPVRRRIALELSVLGWQWRPGSGREVRRLLWNIKAERGHPFQVTRVIPRRLPRANVYVLSIGDDQLSDAEFQAIAAAAGAPDATLDAIEATLSDAVGVMAGRTDSVGRDVTAVAMPHPANGWVRIRFRGDSPAFVQTASGDAVEVGFVPWVVGRELIAPPSVVIGGLELSAGAFRVLVDGPRPDAGLVAAWSSQPRRHE